MAVTRLLVLGGTDFVGRALVSEALAIGWDVTALSRGTREAPIGARQLVVDRRESGWLDVLGDESWDIVVDTWSWEPRAVRDAGSALVDRAETYAYISSRSVHPYPTPQGADETQPLVEASADDEIFDDYPRAKAGGELAAVAAFGDRALLVRPGLIIGPYENIGRLPWWLTRIARGGEIIAPAPADGTFQYIDARDLARFTLTLASENRAGAYNVVNEPDATTIGELLELCREVTGSTGTLRWTDPDALVAAGVEPWMDLPIWIPDVDGHATMHGADVSKAVAAGLAIRPLAETVADTWTWLQSIGGVAPQRPDRPPLGLSAEREAELLVTLERSR